MTTTPTPQTLTPTMAIIQKIFALGFLNDTKPELIDRIANGEMKERWDVCLPFIQELVEKICLHTTEELNAAHKAGRKRDGMRVQNLRRNKIQWHLICVWRSQI